MRRPWQENLFALPSIKTEYSKHPVGLPEYGQTEPGFRRSSLADNESVRASPVASSLTASFPCDS